jgi:hypothetical protein
VTIAFRALNSQSQEIATAAVIEGNLPEGGATVPYTSSSFDPATRCSAIASVERLNSNVIR